jgi:hypothetical protein
MGGKKSQNRKKQNEVVPSMAKQLWNTHHVSYSSTLNMEAADYSERQLLATGCHHPKTGAASLQTTALHNSTLFLIWCFINCTVHTVWHDRTLIKWWNEKNTAETSQPIPSAVLLLLWLRAILNTAHIRVQDLYSYNKTNEMHWYLKFIFGFGLCTFRTVSLSIIRSLALYTQQ